MSIRRTLMRNPLAFVLAATKGVVLAGALVGLVALTANSALANTLTFTANFNSSTLDPNFSVLSADPNFSVTSGSGDLTISKAATASSVGGGPHFHSNFTVPGDFVASVEITGLSSSYFVAGFAADFAGAFSNQPTFAGGGGSTTTSGQYYFSDLSHSAFVYEPVTLPLVLEVERTGDLVTELYGPVGGGLTVINTLSSAEFSGSTSFDMYLYNPATTSAGSVTFSDFTVTYDAPEPSTLMLLGPGLAALGLIRRRFHAGS